MGKPLADLIRPKKLEDVFGQSHLLGEGKVLRKIIETKDIPNMVFYGPSGTGKTTVANIVSRVADKTLYKLNATNACLADIKEVASKATEESPVILYLDEIQNFNKKQQQSLLEYIEDGRITLIASTTENPYFYIYNAILSRCNVFEFHPLTAEDSKNVIKRAITMCKKALPGYSIDFTDEAIDFASEACIGDARKAVGIVEIAVLTLKNDETKEIKIDVPELESCISKKAFRYDRDGDSHYDVLSAFQKSIRGSDPDAALHYLARLIVGGDLISICRRLMVIASEDIGLAYPTAASVVLSCVEAAQRLGFPEARIPLSQAVLLLATAPKSNSALAIDEAIADVEKGLAGEIPLHLKDGHYSGAKALGRMENYVYPHSFKNHYVKQQYLPDTLKDKVYYKYGANSNEEKARKYWEEVKKSNN